MILKVTLEVEVPDDMPVEEVEEAVRRVVRHPLEVEGEGGIYEWAGNLTITQQKGEAQ